MGFQHPSGQQAMMMGKMKAAQSKKTPGHLKAHLMRQAAPGKAMPMMATADAPLKLQKKKNLAMPFGTGKGSPIYG